MSRKRALMKKQEARATLAKKSKKKEKKVLTPEEKAHRNKVIKITAIVGACVITLAAILTAVLVIVMSMAPDIDIETAKVSLKQAGYELSYEVSEAKEYSNVKEAFVATYNSANSDNLSDYMNATTEKIGFICFDTEENAQEAYETFELKWSDLYEECGVSGKIIFFGNTNALDVATAE